MVIWWWFHSVHSRWWLGTCGWFFHSVEVFIIPPDFDLLWKDIVELNDGGILNLASMKACFFWPRKVEEHVLSTGQKYSLGCWSPPSPRFGINELISRRQLSMGWLKGKSTGNHRFSHEIWNCSCICSLKPINWNVEETIVFTIQHQGFPISFIFILVLGSGWSIFLSYHLSSTYNPWRYASPTLGYYSSNLVSAIMSYSHLDG